MKITLALALAALVPAALPAPASADLVVRKDVRLAGYRVKADGTLGGARAAFGRPGRVVRTSDVTCRARWGRHGLRIDFYNLGGRNPCGARTGRFSNAVARGPEWKTAKGLRVGDRVRKLRRLYPDAVHRSSAAFGRGWWLVTRRSPVGEGSSYPGLLARIRDGRVRAFVVRYPAGGD